jgi:O-antigen ligase
VPVSFRPQAPAFDRRAQQRKEESLQFSQIIKPVIWAVVSGTFWVGSVSYLPKDYSFFYALLFGVFAVAIIYQFAKRRFIAGLSMLVYLASLQPALRRYAQVLPYFVLEYVLLAVALVMLSRIRGRVKMMLPAICYGIYVIIEIGGLFQGDSITRIFESGSQAHGRTILIPSITVLVYLLIAGQIQLGEKDLRQLLYSYLVGAASIACLMARGHYLGKVTRWYTDSNFDASGDMGPNQISIILSAAIFICFYLAEKSRREVKYLCWALAGSFTLLMILTFSRGGLYILIGAVLAYHLLKRPSFRSLAAVVVFAGISALVFHLAADVTEGVIVNRYNQFETSNRVQLMSEGWRMLVDHPVWGVGTGNFYTTLYRNGYRVIAGAHNEVVRAGSEHGLIGLFTWIAFAICSLIQAAKRFRGEARAFRLTFLLIAIVSLGYNGLKLMAQPLFVLVAFTAFTSQVSRRQKLPPPALLGRRGLPGLRARPGAGRFPLGAEYPLS